MTKFNKFLLASFIVGVAFNFALVYANFSKSMHITWGFQHASIQGDDLQLVLDPISGATSMLSIEKHTAYFSMLQLNITTKKWHYDFTWLQFSMKAKATDKSIPKIFSLPKIPNQFENCGYCSKIDLRGYKRNKKKISVLSLTSDWTICFIAFGFQDLLLNQREPFYLEALKC